MAKKENKDWAVLCPEGCIRGFKKGSKEYRRIKANLEEIEREFNSSFNPKVRIPADVRLKLVGYGIIDQNDVTIDRKIPGYVENDVSKDGENRILYPFGRFVRHIVRRKGDIRLVDLLSSREKKIIRDFRTPQDHTASEAELPELHRRIGRLYVDPEKGKWSPKGEAAIWHYFATRRPEELGKRFVGSPDRYKERIRYLRDCSRRVISDVYNCVPKSKYWWLVWDALDHCWSFAHPSHNLMQEKQLLEDLNLVPYAYSFLTSNVLELPNEFIKLKTQLISEAGDRHLPGLVDGVFTMGDVFHQMESAFLNAIREKDDQIRERLTSGYTFWIALYLRDKHTEVYEYYLERAKEALKRLRKLKSRDPFEEFEYLDLKARLDGDMMFACVFHFHVRGGRRYLNIPKGSGPGGKGRPKDERIKEALDEVKRWIKRFPEFGIRRYKYKGMLTLNALAQEEIYSTKPDKTGPGNRYHRGQRRGLLTRGEKLLDKELDRIKGPS